MSYSSDVKKELCDVYSRSVHCRLAELAGIISINGRLEYSDDESFRLIIRTENSLLENKIIRLLRMIMDISEDHFVKSNEKEHHRKLIIEDKTQIDNIFLKLKLKKNNTHIEVDNIITQRICCMKSFLRGAFLTGGSIGNPKKAYQFEIAALSEFEAEKLVRILASLHFKSKYVSRRDRFVVYIKDGDTIAGILGILGAVNSYMVFENERILKDIRNSVNREVNCDTANMAKTVNASSKQIDDIKFIEKVIGLDKLPDNLKIMAEVRLKNPYSSMQELSLLFDPPLGKSGISHRLRKLSEIADGLRNDK